MSIAVTWIQGVLRVATGSSGSPRVFVDANAAWSREQFPDALAEALRGKDYADMGREGVEAR